MHFVYCALVRNFNTGCVFLAAFLVVMSHSGKSLMVRSSCGRTEATWRLRMLVLRRCLASSCMRGSAWVRSSVEDLLSRATMSETWMSALPAWATTLIHICRRILWNRCRWCYILLFGTTIESWCCGTILISVDEKWWAHNLLYILPFSGIFPGPFSGAVSRPGGIPFLKYFPGRFRGKKIVCTRDVDESRAAHRHCRWCNLMDAWMLLRRTAQSGTARRFRPWGQLQGRIEPNCDCQATHVKIPLLQAWTEHAPVLHLLFFSMGLQ